MSGSKSTTTATSQTKPWEAAQPALDQVLANATRYGNDVSRFTPTQSSWTQGGLAGLGAFGGSPSRTEQVGSTLLPGSEQGYSAGMDTLMRSARGEDLSGNPYAMGVLDTAAGRTADMVASRLSGAGRYGPNAASARALADAVGEQYQRGLMGNYDRERGYQMDSSNRLMDGGFRGLSAAGAVDQAEVNRANTLLAAGGMQDQFDMASRQAPLRATEWQSGIVSPLAAQYGTSTNTQTQRTPANVPGMVMGGLMTAGGLMTGNPMMAMGGLQSAAGASSGSGGFGSMSGGYMPNPYRPWA